ncbi:MAG: peptidylprolyl isomerase [gamma proteobacterium symbiont of Taylorina sp.]|nr:peptidylprolyl isomerase [gamma proteobacterium symbiont of Taylorina sp.]
MTLKLLSTSKQLTLALAFSGLCITTVPAIAQDTVLAIVNGDKVTESQLKIAAIQSNIKFEAITAVQKKALMDALVNRQLVLQEALKEKFDKDADVAARVKALSDSYVAANYLAKLADSFKVTEAEMQAYYDKKVIGNMPKEYKARHILVKSEEQANALIKEIDGGVDFSKIATEKSTDTGSAAKGGDLGWFTGNNMVASFAQAVAGMKKGELSKTPIQSQFGWHVIILDDERETSPPKFDEVKKDIEKVLIKERLNKYLTNLNNKAKITLNP